MLNRIVVTLGCWLLLALRASAQTLAVDDPVLRNIWHEAMDSSRLELLGHQLLDVIGPRLTGSPQMEQAHEWAVRTYAAWGIEAKKEPWGRWRRWERGITHVDLLEPRVRSLEATMLAWSPATKKNGITAELVILPDVDDSLAFQRWLPSVKGKFVLISMPQPTGRPDKDWEEFALKDSFDSLKALRSRTTDAWAARLRKTGFKADTLPDILEQAGAAGTLTNRWSFGWGVDKVFGTTAHKTPVIDVSLEDYTLLYRLTEYGDKPLIRVVTESKTGDEVPTFNTVATIRGTEKPDEYVILSAHLDSWDAGSGATDNGTGTITMMEAMRILEKYYPHPKRTIIAGHWESEEQGLNGSRAFVIDHPDIVAKAQAVFNQDNGTGRVIGIGAQGLIHAGEFLARWLTEVPSEVTKNIRLDVPGMPMGGGSDNASFTAAGAPGFGLFSNTWDYFLYTWHTNRDTYDKLVFDDLKNNAVLVASLAYLASEDPQFLPRDRRVMPVDLKTGQPRPWPELHEPNRTGAPH